MWNGIAAMENSTEVPQKIKNRIITMWSSNSTSGYTLKEMKVEFWRDICTPMFIAALFTIVKRKWMEEQNVYTCNGILPSPKKDGKSDTCHNMDKPWGHYAKWHKPVTKRQCMVPLTWGI